MAQTRMKILVVGSGGREHVLAWKAAQSPRVEKVFCAPGNAGIAQDAVCVPISATDIAALTEFALKEGIDLTLIGPEAPLTAGIVDAFKAKGLKVFGPDQFCAQLEGSKIFSKRLMNQLSIPTAASQEFTDASAASEYLRKSSYPVVIKADGLAAGKGVTIAASFAEAEAAVREAMTDRVFGDAGAKILIEEFLDGEEASLIAVCDGETAVCLASSQDHKRIFDGDQGPNTGGMGAYSPAPVVTPQVEREALDRVFKPILKELKKQGHPFVGFLYAGLMITAKGVYVLEFNVRFGDPEAQAVLPRLKTDLVDVAEACVTGNLAQLSLQWSQEVSVTVVLAAAGYPGTPRKGDLVEMLGNGWPEGIHVFHAGTEGKNGLVHTAGGRVLAVTALGADVPAAVDRAYWGVGRIRFEGMQFRRDIAHRALQRLTTKGR
jgi:phosphoribosylamine--glycine ligase